MLFSMQQRRLVQSTLPSDKLAAHIVSQGQAEWQWKHANITDDMQ